MACGGGLFTAFRRSTVMLNCVVYPAPGDVRRFNNCQTSGPEAQWFERRLPCLGETGLSVQSGGFRLSKFLCMANQRESSQSECFSSLLPGVHFLGLDSRVADLLACVSDAKVVQFTNKLTYTAGESLWRFVKADSGKMTSGWFL